MTAPVWGPFMTPAEDGVEGLGHDVRGASAAGRAGVGRSAASPALCVGHGPSPCKRRRFPSAILRDIQQCGKSETALPCRLAGTHPLNWLPLRDIICRLTRLPDSGGISTLNRLPLRLSSTTRSWGSTSTPYQSSMGASVSHLWFTVQFCPPVAL